MPTHIVSQGECLSSIAELYGFSWRRLWDDPGNASLRSKRADPNILYPGDQVLVPDKTLRMEDRPTDARHRFVKQGVPVKLRLRLLGKPSPSSEVPRSVPPGNTPILEDPEEKPSDDDVPRSNVPYVLIINGGESLRGTTDGDGRIERNIPPSAREGLLLLEPGTADEVRIPLHLGHLDPISTVSGVRQRLTNLGYECDSPTEDLTPEFGTAVSDFQRTHDLESTGVVDEATRSKIRTVHDS